MIGVLDRLTWPGVPERRRRGFVIDVSLICVIVGLLWAAIALHLLQERSLAESQAELNSSNLALAFEENINRTVASIDQTLRFVRGSYLDNPNFDLARWTRDNAISNDLTFQIAIIDKDGMLRASSLGPVVKPMDLSDREHFRVHLGTSQDTLYISTPVVGRDSGKWSLQFTRKIVAPDGSFDGVVVVSLDPYMLSSFYQSLDLGRGILLLVGVDGVVRARAPVSEHMIGRVIANSPILRSTARHGSFIGRSQLDGVSRISSFRKLTRYPLIVSVGLDLADVLATYRRDKRQYVGVGTCLTFLVLIVGGLMVRHKRRLAYSQQALKDTLENISQGILMVDKHRRAPVINRRAAELLGLPPELIARVPSFDEILKWQLQSGEFGPDGAGKNDLRRFVEAGGIHERFSVYERVRPNGMVLEIRTQALPAGGAVRTFTDITERKRAEDKIRFLAHHDALTGLANRIALDDHLESAIRSISGNGRSVAVLCLDLDRFKLVNDVRGHHVGDQLLIQVANRIRQDVRECDTIARIGGDEFVIVQSIADPADAAALARRLVDSLSRPYDINGQLSMIGVSVGIALHPQNGVAAEELLKNGDTALYRAKEEGGTTFRFFHPSMNIRLYERQLLEQDLREAIAENRLTLHYQPICDTDSRQISGFEALLRWTHPVRGAIPPMEFIPMAEETGLIVPLGRWVLETACAEAATWPGDVHLAVNLSPAQFRQPDLPGLVAGILASTGMCGHRLHLEITEGLLIDDTERVAVTLTALKSQGIRISLDDFGTGHASLSYLRRFAFDKIKIDKSFVQSLGDDDEALAIAQAILTLSSTLRLGVVAEGVETELQLQVLRRLRCSQVQGYLLGRPMPAEMVRACLVPPIPSTA
ncbi:MAG: EAL domain-containing protein [Acidisphaera sp.]|nr:EAL domain-containing protein [Acidisphaera sp.]